MSFNKSGQHLCRRHSNPLLSENDDSAKISVFIESGLAVSDESMPSAILAISDIQCTAEKARNSGTPFPKKGKVTIAGQSYSWNLIQNTALSNGPGIRETSEILLLSRIK